MFSIPLGLDALASAISLYHLTGALHPAGGAVMGGASFVTYSPDGVEPAEKYLRIPVKSAQSPAWNYMLCTLEEVRAAAGRLPIDVLQVAVGPGQRISSVSIAGDSVDALTIELTTPEDLIDLVAAQD